MSAPKEKFSAYVQGTEESLRSLIGKPVTLEVGGPVIGTVLEVKENQIIFTVDKPPDWMMLKGNFSLSSQPHIHNEAKDRDA